MYLYLFQYQLERQLQWSRNSFSFAAVAEVYQLMLERISNNILTALPPLLTLLDPFYFGFIKVIHLTILLEIG